MKTRILKNRVFLTIIISILIGFIIYGLHSLKYLGGINVDINSTILKYTAGRVIKTEGEKKLLNNDIIVVAIDDKTIKELGTYPFSREKYVPVLDALSGSAVVGFDIMFVDENQDIVGDDKFAESIQKAKNVVLGGATKRDMIESIELPLQKFLSGSMAVGYYEMSLDIDNGNLKVIDFVPSKELNGETYDYFGVAILKAYYSRFFDENYVSYEKEDKDFYYLIPRDGYRANFAKDGEENILINFLPLNKEGQPRFSTYSFIDIYNGNVDLSVFDDKIVIIGTTLSGLKDVFYTPNGQEYGVYLVANIINTILTKNFIIYFDEVLEIVLIFLLILFSVYGNLSPHKSAAAMIFVVNFWVFFIFVIILPLILFGGFEPHYFLNYLIELALALFLSMTITHIVKFLIEYRDKTRLNRALSEYVSETIVSEILGNVGSINLDGESRRIAIYFSDIEKFTNISENLPANELVALLREFLSEMSNIILDEKGFINKYEGDCIMALWGVFLDNKESSYLACFTALKQQVLLKELNKKWKEKGVPKINIRIGLHIGEAIVGNIGSQGRKIEFTALGDNVNLASRLEGVNKFYGTYICVSEDIYNENKEKFEFRYLDTIRVEGRIASVKIFELLSLKGELSQKMKSILKKFEKAIGYYKARDFASAKIIFEELVELGDRPSDTYLKRCNTYLKKKPSENWDGVWTFKNK